MTASKALGYPRHGGCDLSAKRINDRDFLRGDQYRQSDNLRARITLHERFSTNPANWFRWLFDHYRLPEQARILEIGCGPGDVWRHNRERIPPGWQLTLSDLSEGMLSAARRNLAGLPAKVCCLDADAFPFSPGSFDAVIANHMLYHVPDQARTLAEVRRALAPSGRLICATNGAGHLAELYDLIHGFDPSFSMQGREFSFTLEDGEELLSEFFDQVVRCDFPNSLRVTEAGPLVDYTLSLWSIDREQFRQQSDAYREYVQARLDADGVIEINKSVGVFVAQRPRGKLIG